MRGYLGLGSNVGDRRANLQAAIDALPAHGVIVLACSSTYDTDPVGEILDQPSFLNACARIETALAPEELLDACKEDRARLGRDLESGVRHAPRPIDVDLLLLGDEPYQSERLTLPHAQATAAALRAHPAARARLRPENARRDAAERLPGGDGRSTRACAARGRRCACRRQASEASRRTITASTSARAASGSSARLDVERGLVERAHQHVRERPQRLLGDPLWPAATAAPRMASVMPIA